MEKKNLKQRKLIFDQEGLELLAKRLKEIRAEKGLSQEEIAYRSEMTLSQIARIETVRINPTISTIFKIARTLDVPLNELFNFELTSLPDKQ
ncbi:transcriptional regulator with XRE-family HTH domain [Flavobacterium nitrogenifigens]|uniref:Transcriptional regulator with XRE-family HTH domain n=2 Tax=Flavobacterium TaxID=237 RepID=A0A7W7J0X7_9FLAO|nr:helix-turn-helix transcriptional regulator [Flavobacterium nitrogenifigens]MBB4804187.1 transcriptional regulator with XRE-family HTH domain [Flavobacterium nitrogenifigens]MBB6389146.1 transcriptional regulator with XRE-family HTH domain [Flavobacterium notoginsengisoli]